MGKNKNKITKTKTRTIKLFSIFCRSVGCGGTTVEFYGSKNGIIAVWSNESCPYSNSDENGAAYDLHNVSTIEWSDLFEAVDKAITLGWLRSRIR